MKIKTFSKFIVLILLLLAFIPLIKLLIPKNDVIDDVINETNNSPIISCNVIWEENLDILNLVSGEIVSDVLVSRIYVSLQGYEKANLSYHLSEISLSNEKSVYLYTLDSKKNILNAFFLNGDNATINLYVEYEGEDYLIDSQDIKIDVESMWSPLQ